MLNIKFIGIGTIHFSPHPLHTLCSLWFNHSDPTGIDMKSEAEPLNIVFQAEPENQLQFKYSGKKIDGKFIRKEDE
jgi:hypothetical protein